MSTSPFTPTGSIRSHADRRRVVFATVIGTTVEWYDFFIYASAAGLVFGQLFFAPAGPKFATVLSFLTVGVSFLFRPLGAFLDGHFGDRYGRRQVLVVTLILMGLATALVGLLPTYEAIGIAAPVLLILLRVLQGISAGGEWGGAVLMAVEHAPTAKRGLFGASPQIGVPLGLLLASGAMALMTVIAPGDAFLAWGWRVPCGHCPRAPADALAYHRVVVGQHDADHAVTSPGPAYAGAGRYTLSRVPAPGAVSSSKVPPASRTRACIPSSPNPSRGAAASKP